MLSWERKPDAIRCVCHLQMDMETVMGLVQPSQWLFGGKRGMSGGGRVGQAQQADCRGGSESRKQDSRRPRQDGQGAGGLEPGWQRAVPGAAGSPGYEDEDGGNIGLGRSRRGGRGLATSNLCLWTSHSCRCLDPRPNRQ